MLLGLPGGDQKLLVGLADEPTGNLDPATRDIVVDALHDHARDGACVVIATHDPAVAATCDQHIALGPVEPAVRDVSGAAS